MTLDAFWGRLERARSAVPLSDLCGLLRNLDVTLEQVRPCVRFNVDGYRRNLLRAGACYHALVLCWRSGQRSPIHDHYGSACAVKVLSGTATETVFGRTAEGLIYPAATRRLYENEVTGSFDDDTHQVSNLEPGGRDLITFHVYSPPLLMMNRYSLNRPVVERFVDPVYGLSGGAGI